jgi:outer membrane lipoprotein-sorting protein
MKIFRAVLILIVMAGCAGPRSAVRGAMAPDSVRARVLSSLRERNAVLKGLRGLADVRLGTSLFGARGQVAFVIQKPNRLRINTMTDFGVDQSQLALNGGTITILWPSSHRYFQGDATPESLARYVGLGLSPETVVDILLGVVPVGGDSGLAVYEAGKGGEYLVKGDGIEAKVETQDDTFIPVRYTVLSDKGRPVYRVAFTNYSKEGRPSWFADRMAAQFWKEAPSRTKARIEIDYKEIEINPKLDLKPFEIKIPNDADRVTH